MKNMNPKHDRYSIGILSLLVLGAMSASAAISYVKVTNDADSGISLRKRGQVINLVI